MTEGQLVMAICTVLALAIYVGSCICLAREAKKIPLMRDEQEDDQRSQRRY